MIFSKVWNLRENRACEVHENLEIKVTVNNLRPLVVLHVYQKKESEKVEKQSAWWRKFLTEKNKQIAIL